MIANAEHIRKTYNVDLRKLGERDLQLDKGNTLDNQIIERVKNYNN